MFAYMCTRSAEEFFKASDKDLFLSTCEFFSVSGRVSKNNIYEHFVEWVMLWSRFRKDPIYVALVTDRFWLAQIEGTCFETISESTKWGDLPECYSDSCNVVPREYRLWNSKEYWMGKSKILSSADFRAHSFIEVLLDGS